MSLPSNLNPSSYEVGFNGDVHQQCKNGTFGECRFLLERQLQRDVGLKNITQEQAVKSLHDADELWAKAKKDPEVREKIKVREQIKADHEAAIVKAAENELTELHGKSVRLSISSEKEAHQSSEKSHSEKKGKS